MKSRSMVWNCPYISSQTHHSFIVFLKIPNLFASPMLITYRSNVKLYHVSISNKLSKHIFKNKRKSTTTSYLINQVCCIIINRKKYNHTFAQSENNCNVHLKQKRHVKYFGVMWSKCNATIARVSIIQ